MDRHAGYHEQLEKIYSDAKLHVEAGKLSDEQGVFYTFQHTIALIGGELAFIAQQLYEINQLKQAEFYNKNN